MMRDEIGSEFWNIPSAEAHCLFPGNTNWFVSGRSALRAIIAENKFKTAALPAWCCESMIQPFLDAGIQVIFYRRQPPEADALLVLDYFGYTSGETYEDYPGVVIRDVTHSLFSASYTDADYYFGSLRKWAGFWTGGFAWGFRRDVCYDADAIKYIMLRRQAMELKADFMSGQSESKTYLEVFAAAENELEKLGVCRADERDIAMAKCIDVNKIKTQRQKNAEVLYEAFSEQAIFQKINDTDCPMFVPLRVNDRDGLRQYLIQHNIYCPVHWPLTELQRDDAEAKRLYEEELSLVCDQRYTEQDMSRMVAAIRNYMRTAVK